MSKKALLVHLSDVDRKQMNAKNGWSITDFRLPFSTKNNSDSAVFHATFLSGAVHRKHIHENCDEYYYVVSGEGLAGAGEERDVVRGGHFHYIPRGVEHWLVNTSKEQPLIVVGIYVGAGSVEETGYIYTGDVSYDPS